MPKFSLAVFLASLLLVPAMSWGSEPSNLALYQPATSSSNQSASLGAANAVDGNMRTRWSSSHSDDNWLSVDLGADYRLDRLALHWETAFAKDYNIQVSRDGEAWILAHSVTGSDGGLDEIELDTAGRYVRIQSLKRATGWGISLWQLEVYGSPEPTPVPSDFVEVAVSAYTASLSWAEAPDLFSYEIFRNGDRVAELLAPASGFTDTNLVPEQSYEYTIRASDIQGNWSGLSEAVRVSTPADILVESPGVTDLARGKPVTASSVENGSLSPELAVDGNSRTRWSSDFTDHNWITVDLQARYDLSEVRIHWQNSYSRDYDIKVSDDGENWTKVHSVVDSDGGWDEWSISGQGRYLRIEGYRRATRWGHSIWQLEVYGTPVVERVSQGRPAFASSAQNGSLGPENAVDGLYNTRWSSDFSDHNWIYVDLESVYQLTGVKLFWENAYSKDYEVQTSHDGIEWTPILSVQDSDGGLDDLKLSGQGRYVRIESSRRATRWGHSLWQLEVYGYASANAGGNSGQAPEKLPVDEPEPLPVPADFVEVESGAQSATLSWAAEPGMFSYEVYRDGERVAEVLAPVNTFTDTDLVSGRSYEYTLRASDLNGNWSELSGSIRVETSAGGVGRGVNLAWRTPDQRENGAYLELDEIGGYEIRYREQGQSSFDTVVIENAYVTDYELDLDEGDYEFSIAVFDVNGLYSRFVNLTPVSQ